ncbi:hypothetical protein SAMN05216349_103135 [Oribacterium sp. KHPX15]|uniref:hypothetical protein n=1 Tax=Oribacterium sp. KHPX15 TaxID=1855342 RepID=UPI0008983252|nr:hypothetical protein [Oribacterium sp. KHPX15]SDZ99061.1 hypothetical protein SAMN05216349_103135 [Oribacterium sp. KHPX15]
MIVLTILKVIGGILLLFLLLILLLLAVVLFVPIRYASDGYKGEELTDYRIVFRADWLMKILRFKAVYTDNGLELLLKLFWITLMKSPEEDEPQEGSEDLREEDLEETDSPEDEAREETEILRETESMEKTELRMEAVQSDISKIEPENLETCREGSDQADSVLEKAEETGSDEDQIAEDIEESSDDIEPDQEKEPDGTSEQSPEQAPDSKKSNNRHIIEKTLLEKIKEQFTAFLGRIKDVVKKINIIREQINDPENQKAVKLLVKNVRYLIKHYKFRVLKGHFAYGSDDPANVGQVMMYLSILHPVYGRNFQIEPVFDRPVMKGDMYFKGHIRLIHLLVSIVELLLNKKIRLVVANHFKGDNDG